MRTKGILTALAVVGVAALSGCAADEAPPETRTMPFREIENGASLEYFTISRAKGVSDEFGDRLTLFFDISNANHIKVSPVATITFADGTELVCTEDDVRRKPSLEKTTTDWDFPCDGSFPDDVEGATIGVEDDYH